ncbi:MAG: PQQ-binding-like beta-propeller repeat protein [Candidatus Dormibacteria bacterium]
MLVSAHGFFGGVSGSAEGNARVLTLTVRPTSIVAGLAVVASLGVAACAGQSPGTVLSAVSCSVPRVKAVSSSTATPAAKSLGIASPVWAGAIGRPSTIVGGIAYGTGPEGRCTMAFDVATGRSEWTVAPPADHPNLFDVVADATTVLAATGQSEAPGPGLNAPLISELVAYNSATGRERWSVTIPDDGQKVPALLTGSTVVVSEEDGTLLGLNEQNGHQLWRDRPQRGCPDDMPPGFQPNAAVIGLGTSAGGTPTAIVLSCEGASMVAVDAATGATRWTWEVPAGWNIEPQFSNTVDAGTPGGVAVAAFIGLIPPANAPKTIAPPPGPLRPTRIGNVYGFAAGGDMVVLDGLTGRVRWALTGVAGSVMPLGGAGSICVVTDAGIDCRRAADGSPQWATTWVAKNASQQWPALGCMSLAGGAQPCVITAGDLLYVALPTAATPAYLPLPGRQSAPGAFVLTSLRLDTGKVMARLPLPAFVDSQASIAISLASPPGVLAVGDGLALVTPEYAETDVVQAFTMPHQRV